MFNPDEQFIEDVKAELGRARAKFPSANLSFVALTEEVGELAQALLKCRAGAWSRDRVRAEAVQVATMALRVAVEADESFRVGYVEPDPDPVA